VRKSIKGAKALAVICYIAGVAAVLYVAVFRYYVRREPINADFFLDYWPWYVIGIALVITAGLLWPKRDRSRDRHD
jgi:hypothetical protein